MEKLLYDSPVIIPRPLYICDLCDLKFVDQNDLDLHNQLHAGTNGFSCPLCKEILPDLHQLQLHDLQHSLAEAQEDVSNLSDIFSQAYASFICIICGEGFSTEEELAMHCALHANVENDGEEVQKESKLMEPIIIYSSGANIVLAKKTFHRPSRPCSRRPPAPFDTIDTQDANNILFENSVPWAREPVPYFTNEKDLSSENEEVEVQDPKPKRRRNKFEGLSSRSKCDQCKRIFSNSFSLKRHKSLTHLNKRPYACVFCRKTFIQMAMLVRHTSRHHMPNPDIFTCEHCAEEFAEKSLLHQHIRVIHNMKYSCEACLKFFAEKEEHVLHMNEHVMTFGFDCCRCRKRYKNEWEMQRHRCLQEGPRPYLCKVCGKRFNRKYHLTRHFSVHQNLQASIDYGVKIECDSNGEIEEPIRLNPRKKKMIHTAKKVDFMFHYKNGRKTMLGKKMNYQCYVCDVKWPNLRRYKQHFMMAHKKIRFNSCHICGKPFNTAYRVRRHLSSHDIPEKTNDAMVSESRAESKIPQNASNEVIHSGGPLASAIENSNKEKKGHQQCYICFQNCSNMRRFKLHFKSEHKDVELNSCHLCSEQFSNAQKVRNHLESVHSSVKTGNVQENSVEQNRPSQIILYNHPIMAAFANANTYGRGIKKTFLCYICKKNCHNYRRYRTHFIIEHKGIKLNSCHICNKQFSTTSKVKRHIQSHTHERNFTCHACGKRFAQLTHLKRHRILMHTVKSFRLSKCMFCPKVYSDKGSFDKHILMHQLAEKSNFKCTICNEKFIEERLLDEHILAYHDFFKKYQCPTCRRRFSHQSYLNRHMIIHSAIRKWKCFTCNRRFVTKSDLTRHSLTHTDLKPFPCFFCEKCFTRSSNRQKHISLFHDIRNVNVKKTPSKANKPFLELTEQQKLFLLSNPKMEMFHL